MTYKNDVFYLPVTQEIPQIDIFVPLMELKMARVEARREVLLPSR
jgi:hypothetical protein